MIAATVGRRRGRTAKGNWGFARESRLALGPGAFCRENRIESNSSFPFSSRYFVQYSRVERIVA